jgi:hypothetical protein
MNRRIRIFASVAMALFLIFSTIADAQWGKKPYDQWTEKEADKVLNDSPWGQSQAFADMSNRFSTGPGRTANPSQEREASTDFLYFRIRFLSAKPIRQAMSRMMELQGRKEMNEQATQQMKGFVDSQFNEHIVISVMCDSRDHRGQLQQVTSLLQTRNLADLQNTTYLVTKSGQRVFLQEYYPLSRDGLGAKFVFPRLVNSQPFITEETGEVQFVSELSKTYMLKMRYKVKDMMYDGKLEY